MDVRWMDIHTHCGFTPKTSLLPKNVNVAGERGDVGAVGQDKDGAGGAHYHLLTAIKNELTRQVNSPRCFCVKILHPLSYTAVKNMKRVEWNEI